MTSSTPEQRRRRYLATVFAQNPVWQASQILQTRRGVLGLKRSDAAEAPPRGDQKQASAAVRQRIKLLQENFWTLPQDELKTQLTAIWNLKLPEFVPVVKRLFTVASCRGAFPELVQEKHMDRELFRAFKTAVVLPPSDAGYAREQFLHSIRDQARAKRVKRAVAIIRDDYPLLYGLEKDWFETLLKLKKPRRSTTANQGATAGVSIELPSLSWGAVVIIMIVLRVVFAVLRNMH